MMSDIIFMCHVIWFIGLILTMTNSTNNVHTAFRLMWGYRMVAFSVMTIGIAYIYVWDYWNTIRVLVTLMLSYIFVKNVMCEHKTGNEFKILFHKYTKK